MIMTRRSLFAVSAGIGLGVGLQPAAVRAAPRVGAPAPAFTAVDSYGKSVGLADLRGKLVVLEWTNDGCPFVQKWYKSGAMQTLQRDASAMGAVWLSVISSAPGEQGAADGPRANKLTADNKAAPAHVLLDPAGNVGHAYEAQVTPHIFVIDKDGVLQYMGGADSIASTKVDDLARATPFARNAITAVAAGKPAPDQVTRAYGCTVKYAV